jgi:protein-S-isoprenylcysteine O-methyltransferase Ste14
MPVPNAALTTGLWLLFSFLWGAKAIVIRWKRSYSKNRILADTNKRFNVLSYVAFLIQIVLIPLTFWSESPLLLEVYRSERPIIFGMALAYSGLALYMYAFVHLGRNHSPCFDSHLPHELVTTGPYRFIRHPGWLSKILVGVAGFFVSGSLWMALVLIWLLIELRRTIRAEERYLEQSLPDYRSYRKRTKMLVPFIF